MSSISDVESVQSENEEIDEKKSPEKKPVEENDEIKDDEDTVQNISKPVRFLRLFKPSKSSVSHIWRGVGRVLKKKSYKPIRSRGFDLRFGSTPLTVNNIETKEEDIVKQDNPIAPVLKPEIALWRHGPAKLWYDVLKTSDDGEGFSYGFKLKQDESEDVITNPIPDEAFLMMNQLKWEEDIIWDGKEVKTKIEKNFREKQKVAGWLPSKNSRTAKLTNVVKNFENIQEETWYSLFPIENDELINGKWEDDVIWDSQAMTTIPVPKITTFDLNDENIIMSVPEDINLADKQDPVEPIDKIKRIHPHEKSTRILLSEAGLIDNTKDEFIPRTKEVYLDPFNISNDRFYAQVTENPSRLLKVSGRSIQHATSVVRMSPPFISTHMEPSKLRLLNRPRMTKVIHGFCKSSTLHPVLPLHKRINKKRMQREQEMVVSGGGQMFQMRRAKDLSGCDGELIMVEFCEEYPPLMNAIGMCSKILNYYQGKPKDLGTLKLGESVPAFVNTFQGSVKNGTVIQALENNLYRAPIFQHKIPSSDFLIIRTKNNFFVREFNALFTAGQECPLMEVPRPTSKTAVAFIRDFIRLFAYRLFWKSEDTPRKIKIEVVKEAFPDVSEGFIRKILKRCSDCKRVGTCTIDWILKPDFRLPSEDEMCDLITPEQYCAYFSMLSAQQRLKDAGYGEKVILAEQIDEDEEEKSTKMEDEVKAAPWNTTKAYLESVKGKCILQLHGPADPTGCGEGFSYIRLSKRNQNSQEFRSKKISVDGDLRRMKVSEARLILREHGLKQDAIKKLSRWEIVAAVRTLSTEKTKAGEGGLCKYSRINSTITEVQERYMKNCENIFELQNSLLKSSQVLSTDDDDSTESEDSDFEELGKNLEMMLSENKSSTQISFEREEQERRELLEWIEDNKKFELPKIKEDVPPSSSRFLRITRTIRDENGNEFSRVETVRKPAVIDLYVKIRTTKSDEFIKHYAVQDEKIKEAMRRERRNIMAQLRTIKKNEEISAVKNSKSAEVMTKTDVNNNSSNMEVESDKSIKTKKKIGATHCDYLDKNRISKRARKNPNVEFARICDKILMELTQVTEYKPFICPVRLHGYTTIVKKPMDIQTMRDKLKDSKYSCRGEFLADVVQIVDNSKLYNGAQNYFTLTAQQMLQDCVDKLTEQEDELMLLESAIDPDESESTNHSNTMIHNGEIIDVGSEDECAGASNLPVAISSSQIIDLTLEDSLGDMEFSDTDEE
ncbi:unnamed protein product [Diamesa tonsa]